MNIDYANNLLHDASVDGDLNKVRFAIEKLNAEIDSLDGYALYQACKNGHFYVMQYLISHGADPRANGGRAFFWACELFNFEIVDYFFDYKLVTDKMFKSGLESLLTKHEFEFAKHFITKRNQFESDALVALITACEFSIPEFVKELLDLGVDPDSVLELKLNIDDEVNDILLAYSNHKKLGSSRKEPDQQNTIIVRDPSL